MAAVDMMGTTFTWNGTSVTLMHELDGPEIVNELLECTNFGSANGTREYIAGPKDGGEVSFGLRYDPTDASHQALVTDANTNPSPARAFAVNLGGVGVSWSGTAIITSFKPGGSFEDVLGAEATLKVTGALTIA